MPSIQEAQAKALREGFFDTLGETQIASPTLSTFEAMLALYAKEFINKAKDNLNKTNSITTGKLESSMRFETTRMGRGYNLSIFVLDYYKYVDQGVQGAGLSRKNNDSPYKFKYLMGQGKGKNKKSAFITSIEKWIIQNRLTYTIRDKARTKRESKSIPATVGRRTLAYLIARSIKNDGLYRTNFWSDAFEETFKDFAVQMSKALGEDIKIDLRNAVKELKK